MNIHVLPVNSLAKTFKETDIEGEIVVCPEFFKEGNIESEKGCFWDVLTTDQFYWNAAAVSNQSDESASQK